MPAPQINQLRETLVIPVGHYFATRRFAPGASAWNADNLPSGLDIDNTGLISGTPTTVQEKLSIITPSNGDGLGEPLQIDFSVRAPVAQASSSAPRIFFDLNTRQVYPVGGKPGDVVFLGRTGNRGATELYFLRSGAPDAYRPRAVYLTAKEQEPEAQRYSLVPDPTDLRYLGSDASSVTVFRADLGATALRTLAGSYEGDQSTGLDATAELTVVDPIAPAANLPEPVFAETALELAIPGVYPLGDFDTGEAVVVGLTSPGWYTLDLLLEETDFGDGAIHAVFHFELAASPAGLTLKSQEYDAEASAPTGEGTGGKAGIHLSVGLNGGEGALSFVGGELRVPIRVNSTAEVGTGATSMTPTVTAEVSAADMEDYDAEEDNWDSLPFKLRIERDLRPES